MALTTKTNIGTKFSTVAESTRASVTAIPRENEPVIVVDGTGKRIGLCFGDGVTQLKDLELIGSGVSAEPILSNNNNYFDYGFVEETNNYRDRVVLDGGSVEELEEVDNVFSASIENLKFYISVNAGIKKDANNLISKAYSLDSNNRDAEQSTVLNQPILKNGFIDFETNDHLVAPPVITTLFGTTAITVACWISVSATQQPEITSSLRTGAIIGQDYFSGAFNNGYGILIRDNRIWAQIRTKTLAKSLDSGIIINDGKLHRAVAVFDITGGFIYLYIDGVLTGSIDFVVNATDTTSLGSLKIARSNSETTPLPFIGKIKTAEIWTEAWNQAKVTADFNNKPL